MVKRRTLGEGLSPDEEEFLNSGKPAHKQAMKSKPAKTKEVAPPEISAAPAVPVEQLQSPVQPPVIQAPIFKPQQSVPGAMALNTRLTADLSSALLTASMQRKIQRLEPFTQQGIVGEALTDWLQKHGFLPR